jgi:hypothetical protein
MAVSRPIHKGETFLSYPVTGIMTIVPLMSRNARTRWINIVANEDGKTKDKEYV